jgi:hypothetical protein
MSDAFKQGALTYGFGKVASPFTSKIPGIGTDYSGLEGIMQFGRDAGSSLQGGYNALKTKLAPAKLNKSSGVGRNIYQQMGGGADMAQVATKPGFVESIGNKISSLIPESTLGQIALGGGAVALGTALLGGGPQEVESAIMERGEGLDLDSIRLEVREAFKDETGEKLLALRNKYPYLGTQASKDVANMAMGGRIGFSEGGGLTEYEAYRLKNMGYDTKGGKVLEPFGGIGVLKDILRVNRANGGIMDLGGMEKDYRNTGGFVDIGEYEKKDDVPARLSVNEFVMTADAVRAMGS